jgi:hypothetical protein
MSLRSRGAWHARQRAGARRASDSPARSRREAPAVGARLRKQSDRPSRRLRSPKCHSSRRLRGGTARSRHAREMAGSDAGIWGRGRAQPPQRGSALGAGSGKGRPGRRLRSRSAGAGTSWDHPAPGKSPAAGRSRCPRRGPSHRRATDAARSCGGGRPGGSKACGRGGGPLRVATPGRSAPGPPAWPRSPWNERARRDHRRPR